MAAKKPRLPIDVVVGGARRHVVAMDTKTWTEQEPSGRLVIHVGKLLLDGPTPTKIIDKPRACTVCKTPTITTTMLGRPIHDTCEGWMNVMPDDVEARALFDAAIELGVKEVIHRHDTRKEVRRDHRRAA